MKQVLMKRIPTKLPKHTFYIRIETENNERLITYNLILYK